MLEDRSDAPCILCGEPCRASEALICGACFAAGPDIDRAADADRDRQLIALRAKAPLRRPAEQLNELDTPLFGAAASPSLL